MYRSDLSSNRATFDALMRCYREGKCDLSEKNFIDQLLLSFNEEKIPENTFEWDAFEESVWQKIQTDVSMRRSYTRFLTPPVSFWDSSYFRISAAASLALCLGYGLFLFNGHTADPSLGAASVVKEDAPKEMVNTSSQTLNLTLEDGTSIDLKPNAKITYPAHFDSSSRQVSLVGEAYFEVTPNPKRPFFITTGDVATKVVGTSFSIVNQPELNKVEVVVHSGKVSVFKKTFAKENLMTDTATSIVLTPNHKVTYFAQSDYFLTGLVEQPRLLTTVQRVSHESKTISFIYDDTPLGSVVQNLERAYGVHITLENEDLSNCPLTADLSGQSFSNKLELICRSINAKYSVNGAYVTISGHGCR